MGKRYEAGTGGGGRTAFTVTVKGLQGKKADKMVRMHTTTPKVMR